MFGKALGSDGGIIVGMITKLQKTTISPVEITRRILKLRMMTLGMRRRHQVVKNGGEIDGAPVDCPGPGKPQLAFCGPVAAACSK